MNTLGERIRQARQAAGLSQGQLGQQCGGLSREAVSQWEANDTRPASDRLTKIAAATGADLAWLLTEADSPTPSLGVMDTPASNNSAEHAVPISDSPPVSPLAAQFGQRLREIRKRLGLTLREVGDRLDVTEGTVGHWENGRREPNLEKLLGLAKVLGLSPADFFTETTPSAPADSERWAAELFRTVPASKREVALEMLRVLGAEAHSEVEQRVLRLFRSVPEEQRALALQVLQQFARTRT
jgi:transcriptional regulator with XRE-family HTH domain